jgi:hypothetical protein
VLVSKSGARAVGVPDFGYGRNPLDSLPAAERLVCGRLVMRQLRYGPQTERLLKKYGPEGTVRLCSARAFGQLELAFVVPVLGLSLAGEQAAAGVCSIPILVLLVLLVMRAVSAGIAGRRWRSAR